MAESIDVDWTSVLNTFDEQMHPLIYCNLLSAASAPLYIWSLQDGHVPDATPSSACSLWQPLWREPLLFLVYQTYIRRQKGHSFRHALDPNFITKFSSMASGIPVPSVSEGRLVRGNRSLGPRCPLAAAYFPYASLQTLYVSIVIRLFPHLSALVTYPMYRLLDPYGVVSFDSAGVVPILFAPPLRTNAYPCLRSTDFAKIVPIGSSSTACSDL